MQHWSNVYASCDYNVNGSLPDRAFGHRGLATSTVSGKPEAIATAGSRRILVAGREQHKTVTPWTLARFKAGA